MEEMIEYELLNIEWKLNYEFDKEPSSMLVKDGSDDQPTEQENQPEIVCDENGIPQGTSYEEERIRKELIYSFIKKWKEDHEECSVFNLKREKEKSTSQEVRCIFALRKA